jgi:hypothetical protein
MQSEEVWEGRSDEELRGGCLQHNREGGGRAGRRLPVEFEITLRAARERGHSLSEYIAMARGVG